MVIQTEYDFKLPKGYVDDAGDLHNEGMMRLANAADEILPLKDPRVQSNPAYLSVIVLSRVITRLGAVPDVNPKVIEGLFIQDLSYLQELYRRINGGEELTFNAKCPQCDAPVEASISRPGGS